MQPHVLAVLLLEGIKQQLINKGVSDRWTGEKNGKPYIYWYEGKNLRSRKAQPGESATVTAQHDRMVYVRWLSSMIEYLENHPPKRANENFSTALPNPFEGEKALEKAA